MSLSGYLEALEAWNEANAPEQKPASPEFREQMQRIFAAEKAKKVEEQR